MTKVTPLILRDHEYEMPSWIYDVLTEAQANEDRTSGLWRWQRVLGTLDLPGPAKAIALWIASHCNSSRLVCYPSIATLSSESGFSRKTVERAISQLEDMGLIYVWRQKPEDDKRRRTNHYAPAWPEHHPTLAHIPRCGEPARRGEPCQRRAGWGVEGMDEGPCAAHRTAEVSAGDAVRTAGDAVRCRQEMPSCAAGDAHEGTKQCSRSLKELLERAARQKSASGEGSINFNEESLA